MPSTTSATKTQVSTQETSPSGETQACPFCQKTKHMKKSKPLYDSDVCSKCYYGFMNRRQAGWFLDLIFFRFVHTFLVVSLVMAVPPEVAPLAVLGALLAHICMMLMKDGIRGCSPGKWICGVRVVDEETEERIGFAASVKRNLPTLIPFVPIFIAFTLGKGKRLGDGWARSRVVLRKHADNPVFSSSARVGEIYS